MSNSLTNRRFTGPNLDPPGEPEICTICLEDYDSCICPECPICESCGDPNCLDEHFTWVEQPVIISWFGDLANLICGPKYLDTQIDVYGMYKAESHAEYQIKRAIELQDDRFTWKVRYNSGGEYGDPHVRLLADIEIGETEADLIVASDYMDELDRSLFFPFTNVQFWNAVAELQSRLVHQFLVVIDE